MLILNLTVWSSKHVSFYLFPEGWTQEQLSWGFQPLDFDEFTVKQADREVLTEVLKTSLGLENALLASPTCLLAG